MTLYDLKQLGLLDDAINYQVFRLEKVRELAGIHSPSLDGMPHGNSVRDKIGDLMPKIIETEDDVIREIRKLVEKQTSIEEWIHSVGDMKFELICLWRFKEKWSWERIADELSGNSEAGVSECAARKYLERKLTSLGVIVKNQQI